MPKFEFDNINVAFKHSIGKVKEFEDNTVHKNVAS